MNSSPDFDDSLRMLADDWDRLGRNDVVSSIGIWRQYPARAKFKMQVAISNDSHAVSGSHFRGGWQIFNATYKLDTAVIRRTVESPALRHLALRQSA